MRVVLDTNILISAFVFPGGAPEMVYRGALEGRYELVTSPSLLAELGRVLGDIGWEASVGEAAVTQVARVGTVVRPRERLAVIADDPADDRVLEAAIEGGAEVSVSGDRHLGRLSGWGGVEVVRAPVFVDRLGPPD